MLACFIILTVLLVFDRSPEAAPKQEVIVVDRPTVVSFFPPVTDAELAKNPDLNETLFDFQYYTRIARNRLEPMGIQFKEIYATSFALRVQGKTKTIQAKKIQVGYYFLAPDKPPRIQSGVTTDNIIVAIANEYFQLHVAP